MTFDATLAERIGGGLARRNGIEGMKMFGGAGFLPDGNLFPRARGAKRCSSW
jgi:hypothetical protein